MHPFIFILMQKVVWRTLGTTVFLAIKMFRHVYKIEFLKNFFVICFLHASYASLFTYSSRSRTASKSTISKLSVPEGSTAVIAPRRYPPLSADGTLTETWSFIRNQCDGIFSHVFCSTYTACTRDVFIDESCEIEKSEEIPLSYAVLTTTGHFGPLTAKKIINPYNGLDITIKVSSEYSEIIIYNVTLGHAGTYIRYNMNTTNAQKRISSNVFMLHVIPKRHEGVYTDMTVNKADKVSLPKTVPRLLLNAHHSLLYHDQELFTTSVTYSYDGFPSTFDFEFKWFFFSNANGKCKTFVIHEPCIYHPLETECAAPFNISSCHITNFISHAVLGFSTYVNCNGTIKACLHEDNITGLFRSHIKWDIGNEPNLKVNTAGKRNSGLYIVVGTLNNRRISFTYMYVSTISLFARIIVDKHKPNARPYIVESHILEDINIENVSHKRRIAAWILVLIIILSVLILFLITMTAIFTIRRFHIFSRHHAIIPNGTYYTYSSLPSYNPYTDYPKSSSAVYHDDTTSESDSEVACDGTVSSYRVWLTNDKSKLKSSSYNL